MITRLMPIERQYMPLRQCHPAVASPRAVFRALGGLAIGLAVLGGCGPAAAPTGINDPYEASNRKVHAFNKSLDRGAVRPSANAYGTVVPGPLRTGVQNFAQNLGEPGNVANDLLQFKLDDALVNTIRFAVNSTIGIGGLFDPATPMGIPGDRTDFGETLAVWGVGEGRFVELPLIGASTERDTVGMIVDVVFDPLRFILPTAEANAATGIQVAAGLGRRYRYSATIDSILYESADSYAQARLLYLQNRRFELGQTAETADFVDPYEDPYAE